MNMQMMEGLLGASSNIKLSNTPRSVYRQASAEGDTEKMKRALGYYQRMHREGRQVPGETG